VSVVNIIFIYYIEAAHATVIFACWSFMLFDMLGPMPFYLAQLIFVLCWSAVDVMLLLGSSISILKILYVTKFYLIFNQDQEALARIILNTSLLLGCTPHIVIFLHHSAAEQALSPGVHYFMGKAMARENLAPFLICGAIWTFLCVVLSIFAILLIRNYERSSRYYPTESAEEQGGSAGKTISLPRVLLGATVLSLAGIIGIIIQVYELNVNGQFPIMFPIYVVILYLKLVFLALHENIIVFSRNKIAAKVHNMRSVLRTFLGCQPPSVNPA
jgi:hypothetical protein